MTRWLCLIIFVFAPLACQRAPAETPRSIQSVPSDAAFFFGLHNQADLIRRIANSETVRRFRAIAGDEIDLQDVFEIELTPDEDSAVDSADAIAVFRQLLCSDVFLFGDANWAQTLRAIDRFTRQSAEAENVQGEQFDSLEFFLSLPDDEFSAIRLPSTVLAFQLTDVEPVQRLLNQTHVWLSANPPPPWALYRGRKPVGDDHMLVFTLRPWESDWVSVDWDETDVDPQAVMKKFQRVIDGRELVIAVGIVRSRLTACFAEDLSAVRRLVETESNEKLDSIADQPDFKNLLSEQDGPLIASAHVSDDFVAARIELQAPGFLSNMSSLLATLPSLVSAPGLIDDEQMGQIGAITLQTSEKLKSISERWDALARAPAGRSSAFWAGRRGISGRSFVRSVDRRLPDRALDVHQFVGEDVIFVYGWQSTTMVQRMLLAIEAGASLLDLYMAGGMVLVESDESLAEDIEKWQQARVGVANCVDDLNRIVLEHVLPSLHDGGHAIVISAIDPDPNTQAETPFAISAVTRVWSAEGLRKAGTLLRNWSGDLASKYLTLADEPMPESVIPEPIAVTENDSTVFRLPINIETAASDATDSDQESNPGLETGLGQEADAGKSADFHWRLSDQVLVFGSDPAVSRQMMKQQTNDWSNREGVLRSIMELSFRELSELYRKAIVMVPEEDKEMMLQFADVITTLDTFKSETRTIDGQTQTHWQFGIPLGD